MSGFKNFGVCLLRPEKSQLAMAYGVKKSQWFPWDSKISSPKWFQSLGFGCPRDFCPGTVPAVFVPVPIPSPGPKSHEIRVLLPIPVIYSVKIRDLSPKSRF